MRVEIAVGGGGGGWVTVVMLMRGVLVIL